MRRLRDLGWEVLGADPNMSVTPADSTERKLLDQVYFLWPYLSWLYCGYYRYTYCGCTDSASAPARRSPGCRAPCARR